MHRMACGQDRVIRTGMTLGGAHIADTVMAMLDVVPLHKLGRPAPGGIQILESPGWELRPDLAVRNSASAEALSSLTRGREYEGLMSSQWSIASTVVAFYVAPLSPCSTGLDSRAAMLSESAVRRTRCAACWASSRSCTSQPTILRL